MSVSPNKKLGLSVGGKRSRTDLLLREIYSQGGEKVNIPIGTWKSGLRAELVALEENLGELYKIIGVAFSASLQTDSKNDDDDLGSSEKLSETKSDYETIINEHLYIVNSAAHNICALLGLSTEFELPIPVSVILNVASKIGLIRWKDYKKRPNGLLRSHVYSLTPHLIKINMVMLQSLVSVLGSNIIPFTPVINQSLVRILEWTRTSNFMKHDENECHSIRSQVFKTITFILEQLSLNMNFEPQLLHVLLEVELLDNLEEMVIRSNKSSDLGDKHAVDALVCLENLIIAYGDFLEARLQSRIRSYVIQTCVKIYRDFESTTISLACRKQLLHLLLSVANQPYASSTTEVAYHIFELVVRMEHDPEMRSLANRSLSIGLAHRPTIVTHYDVFNCYSRPMLAEGHEEVPQMVENNQANNVTVVEEAVEETMDERVEETTDKRVEETTDKRVEETMEKRVEESAEVGQNGDTAVLVEDNDKEVTVKTPEKAGQESEEQAGDESEILSYMSYFVEKLA